jgi:hypothetical protein
MRSTEASTGQNLQKSNIMSVQIGLNGGRILIFWHLERLGKLEVFPAYNGVLSRCSAVVVVELEVQANGICFHRFRSWH